MNFHSSEIEHHYGKNVHILNDPTMSSWLARLCSPDVFQPTINSLVEFLYTGLMQTVANVEFPQNQVEIPTRMSATHPQSPLIAKVLKSNQKVVSVNLARAGTLPSHICYSLLNNVINPQLVRQDHILASRTTDQSEKVTGTNLGGHKIGGDVKDSIVLFPDPMGATGSTIVSALNHYKHNIEGPALKYIALHLIVTPEYLKRVSGAHPDLKIYAVRVDRGLSSKEVQNTVPGTFWDQERGLNDKQYIVPGGGGFGEIMNNSFV